MRVILVDDLVPKGVARVLVDHGFEVVAQLGEASGLLAAVETHHPHVVILDIRMPPTHTVEGLTAALELRARHPDVAVLVLSQHVETRYAVGLVGSGRGVGYLLKERVGDVVTFADTVRRVALGGSAVDPEVVERLLRRASRRDPLERLSEREREVLALMAEGRSNTAIAERLYLNAKKVESHVRNVFTKLDLLPEADDHRPFLSTCGARPLRSGSPTHCQDRTRRSRWLRATALLERHGVGRRGDGRPSALS